MTKKILLCMMLMLPMMVQAQEMSYRDKLKEARRILDEYPEEQKDAVIFSAEKFILNHVDSLIEEGLYRYASEVMDTIEIYWKDVTGKNLSGRFYATLSQNYMWQEEWRKMCESIDKYLVIYKSLPDDSSEKEINRLWLKSLYLTKGMALNNLEEWNSAIDAYEKANYLYAEVNDLGNQGGCLCNMAECYDKLGKPMMARNLFEKGFQKYLDNFDITRSALLRSEFSVTGILKSAELRVFSEHLYQMALYEQEHGTRSAMKDYLLMAAHCGNQIAKEEYKRIFGY